MNKSKGISLLKYNLVCLFAICCSFINVKAACNPGDVLISTTTLEDGTVQEVCSSTTACKNLYDSNGNVNITAVSDKYQPKLTRNDDGTWKVTINPADANDASVLRRLKDVRFKLYSINGVAVTGDKYVSYNHPLTVTKQLDADGYMTLKFKADKEHLDPDCKSEFLEFVVELLDGGDPTISQDVVPDIPPVGVPVGTVINCGQSHAPGTFGAEFCKAKGNASISYPNRFDSTNGTAKKYKDVFGSNSSASFTCNNTTIRSKDYIAANGEDGYYLSENTSYMFGSGEFSINNGRYRYRYSPCNPTNGAAVTCKVRCEEAVIVQYGAPVASKAGLCFEYKVKVTSRVSCEMSELPPLPDKVTTVCTPTPTCTGIGRSGNRYYLTEGGPNEDFHACVEACDGGIYSSKCSKKCYKDVYQKGLITYNSSKTASGGYYCQNGSVSWHGGGPGRYYGGGCKSQYEPDGNGICRHHYSNGTVCQDDCWWNSCPSGVYLNPGYSGEDYSNNMELYNQAVAKCTAAARCSTSQAEFTIAVDYKDDSNTVRTINFPYNENVREDAPNENLFSKDKLCSRRSEGSCSTTAGTKTSTILKYDGCYNRSSTDETIYFSEWGFPSSWLNRKTGELSYKVKNESDIGWQEIKDKFCLPFHAQDVNEKWWRYYYKSLGEDITCPYASTVDSYNIRAKATDFGYFGWNIDVKCFYAVGDDNCGGDTNPTDVPYVIRSVDLENLFPATDGSSLTSSNDIGRTPGFNWSEDAKNEKNLDYTSNPDAYAKYIQDKGYSIYSDDNLDYEFYLSPDVLRQLKGARSDYTLFRGSNITDIYGVIRYKSDLFRGSGVAASRNIAKKIPEESQIRCNNLSLGGCQSS